MALEATFRELAFCLHQLHDALNALQVTVGDKPEREGAVLVDDLENAALDMVGTLHEARKAAVDARKAVGHPLDLDRARRELTVCHARFHRVEALFTARAGSYEKMRDLDRLASERRGEWASFISGVKPGIEQCRAPIQETSKALAGCWQEIAEHLGATNVSVHTNSVGQHITMSGPEAAAAELAFDKTP